jgi:hypothetical protein
MRFGPLHMAFGTHHADAHKEKDKDEATDVVIAAYEAML